MKKFTLFMLAACAWFTASTSAMAEETTTEPTVAESPTEATDLASGYYVVKVHAKGITGYVYHSTTDTGRPFRVKPESDATDILAALSSNTAYVWYVNKSSDGTFTLQNLSSGDYIPAQEQFGSSYNDMRASVSPHTFANAGILKPASYTAESGSSYTPLTGGMFLSCANYSAALQIHTNQATNEEMNLSYWGSTRVTTNGSESIVEFAFYKVSGEFSSEDNIQKNSLIEVTETEGTTTTKWAGYAGQTYTLHTSLSDYVNVGFAFTTTAPTMTYEPTDLTISESNHAYTITKTSASYTPVDGVFNKYYRIYSKTDDGRDPYMSTERILVGTDGLLIADLDRKVRVVKENAALLPQIWQLVDAGNGLVKIKNVNNSRYISYNTSQYLDMPTNDASASTFYIKKGTGLYNDFNAETDFELNTNGHTVNCGNSSRDHDITIWDGYYGAKDNFWSFEEVTSVPVTIDATAQYATIGLPFAVSVPDGVTAYTAESAADGYITLKEITSKVIPSNTGAILYKENGGEVTLTITSEPNTEIGNNILTATTAKRTGYTSGDTYVLALNSSDEAAFLKSELTVVPANKAYIATSALPTTDAAANVLNFNFGGDVTGIHALDTVDGTSAPTTYYDLNGRRVLYPAHGIYVTAKGKKVLVK